MEKGYFYNDVLYNVIIMDNIDESFISPHSLDVMLKVLYQLKMS